jgi:hypothetical protein
MKKAHLYKTVSLLSFFIIALLSEAQQTTTVRAAIDKTNILIGEQLTISLQANIPENNPIRFFSVDSVPHFEILEKTRVDTVNTSTGTELKQTLRLTSFDSGQWVIPSFPLAMPDGPFTDSFTVHVSFAPFDSAKDYNDIKNIIPAEAVKKKDFTWYYIGLGLLLLGLIIYLLLRKRHKHPVAVVKLPEDPYAEALKKLEALRQPSLQSEADVKMVYSTITDIFRAYLKERMGIHSLQQTTDDLVLQLRNTGIRQEQFSRLSQALRLADFVKFAKYIPAINDFEFVYSVVKETIISIEALQQPAKPPEGS